MLRVWTLRRRNATCASRYTAAPPSSAAAGTTFKGAPTSISVRLNPTATSALSSVTIPADPVAGTPAFTATAADSGKVLHKASNRTMDYGQLASKLDSIKPPADAEQLVGALRGHFRNVRLRLVRRGGENALICCVDPRRRPAPA